MILENTSETPGDSLLKTLGGTWRSLGSVSKGCVISLGAEGTELEAAGTGELSMLVWSEILSSSCGGGTVRQLMTTLETA